MGEVPVEAPAERLRRTEDSSSKALAELLLQAERKNSSLQRRLEVYTSEALVAQSALEQCSAEAAEALRHESSLQADGYSGVDLDAEAEAAALANALIASEMALEATLADRGRLVAELERASTAPQQADNGRSEAAARYVSGDEVGVWSQGQQQWMSGRVTQVGIGQALPGGKVLRPGWYEVQFWNAVVGCWQHKLIEPQAVEKVLRGGAPTSWSPGDELAHAGSASQAPAEERQLVSELLTMRNEMAELCRRAANVMPTAVGRRGPPSPRAADGTRDAAACRDSAGSCLGAERLLSRGCNGGVVSGDDLLGGGETSVLAAVGILGDEVRCSRAAIEAAEARARRAEEEANSRCIALQQELAQREAEFVARSRAAESELEDLRGKLDEAKQMIFEERVQQATELAAALTRCCGSAPLIDEGDHAAPTAAT